MNKVVYNACYGGFGISAAAVERLKELGAGDQLEHCGPDSYWTGTRHDPRLVQVVKELGNGASSLCARLRIAEINGSVYRIREYDGYESVIEPNNQEWVAIK